MAVTFSQLDLHASINKALTICGYTNPTLVQAQSIPDILNGKDVAVSAQTGSGKTAAFVLPALQQLTTQQRAKKTRVLILTPTRELANQISKAASLYGKFLQFNIVDLVGGMPYHQQIRNLARGADIIVATPGRLLDHIEQKRVDLSNIQMLVLDEADRMLDMGFIDDVHAIANLTPANRQTLLFSATLDNKLVSITRRLLKNPVRIDLSNERITAPQIRQELYKTSNAQYKFRLLKHFLNEANIYKAIIFSATKINADKLANQLRDEGFAAAALHGDLRQNVRNRTIDQLRRDKIQILVATDVAARGIDISDITHVINYDLPRFCQDYVHRIGRTGRAGKSGIAISFVLPTDVRHVQRIERYIGQHLKLMSVAINDNGSDSKLNRDFDEKTPVKAKNDRSAARERDNFGNHTKKQASRKHKTTSKAKDDNRYPTKTDKPKHKKKFFSNRKKSQSPHSSKKHHFKESDVRN